MDECTATDNKPSNEKKKAKQKQKLKGLQTNKLNMMDSHCGYHLLSDSVGQDFHTLVTVHDINFIPLDFS